MLDKFQGTPLNIEAEDCQGIRTCETLFGRACATSDHLSHGQVVLCYCLMFVCR